MSTIRLQSVEGEIFEVDEKAAKCSGTIKTMLEDCGIEAGSDEVVSLQNVKAATLRKYLEWANHHKDDPPVPLDDAENKDKKKPTQISPWDAEFLKVDQGTLLDLVMAANYLDARPLFEAACATVANQIKGKKVDELRKQFNIVDDNDYPDGVEHEY